MTHIGSMTADAARPALQASAARPRRPFFGPGFFRYHGLWAPGVRLFRILGFNAKATIITLTFMLPIGVLSWNYFFSQGDQIDFSAKELEGTVYARDAYALLPTLMQARRADAGDPAALRQQLTEALTRLKATEDAHGASLGTTKSYAAFATAAQAVIDAKSTTDDAGYATVTTAVRALIDLIAVASDGSNLTLDPDIDTYYLMDATMFKLPAMLEAAGQLGTLGGKVLGKGQASPAELRRLIEQAAILSNSQDGLAAGIDKVLAYNADVKSRVHAGDAARAVADLVQLLEHTVLDANGLHGQPPEVAAAADHAIDTMMKLNQEAEDALDALIAARVGRLVSSRNMTFVLVCLSLLTAMYLFTAFRKVLHGGLREVAFHIDQMRDGDLTAQPHAWGADEAAGLIRSLNQMQDAMRALVMQVRHAAEGIVTASGEIAAGSNDLSTRTEQSATHLEETAAAMEQITAGVQHNADAVVRAADIATGNADAAQRGGAVVNEVIERMRRIDGAAARIGDIIGTIDSIAFQTNILALNAAVEAARAGEQGRGFGVVAAEVRALAKRSADAAREIKSLISHSVEQVQGGMEVAQKAGDLMAEVVMTSTTVNSCLGEAVTGAREQSSGIASTTRSVQELDTATQQNAALVEQTAAAASALKDQAEALSHHVARFKLPH